MKLRSICFVLFAAVILGGALCAQAVKITQGPKVEHVAVATAVIAWSTDAGSSTVVRYGMNASDLSQEAKGSDSSGTHRVTLSKLRPATTYYFVAESNGAKSGVRSFTTRAPSGVEPPNENSNDQRILVGPVPQQVSDNSAAIWWVAVNRNKSQLVYGTAANQMSKQGMEDASDREREHHAALTSLQPETTYYYAILDADGKSLATGQLTTEPKGFRSGGRVWITDGPVIEYLDSGAAVVAWSTSVNASTIVRYSRDPNDLNRNAEEKWGQETHRVTLKKLRPDAKYYFVIESGQGQGSGMMAKSNVGQFRTLREGEPALKDIAFKPK
ncbi:MAG: fibronectin type III domain-containing protein [Acidobacteriaceae bacterium]